MKYVEKCGHENDPDDALNKIASFHITPDELKDLKPLVAEQLKAREKKPHDIQEDRYIGTIKALFGIR